jgi:hypothetical protein
VKQRLWAAVKMRDLTDELHLDELHGIAVDLQLVLHCEAGRLFVFATAVRVCNRPQFRDKRAVFIANLIDGVPRWDGVDEDKARALMRKADDPPQAPEQPAEAPKDLQTELAKLRAWDAARAAKAE